MHCSLLIQQVLSPNDHIELFTYWPISWIEKRSFWVVENQQLSDFTFRNLGQDQWHWWRWILSCFDKVQIFWEGHKNLKKNLPFFLHHLVASRRFKDLFKNLWTSQNIWTLVHSKYYIYCLLSTKLIFFVLITASMNKNIIFFRAFSYNVCVLFFNRYDLCLWTLNIIPF